MFGKSKLALIVAEFFGAATLTAVVLAVSKSGVGFPYFIAIGMGIAVAVMLLAVGSVRDVSFNPAITFGLWSARKVSTLNAVVAIAGQMLGAVAAWKVFEYLTDAPLQSIANKEFDWRVFTAEAIGTFILGLAVSAVVYYEYKGNQAAATIGAGLFLAIVLSSVASNGLVNPAVALGVQSWSLAYVAGPLLGALLAVNFYAIVFAPSGSFMISTANAVSTKPATTKKVATKKVAASKAVKAKKAPAKKKVAAKRTTTRKR